jgi:hypothetical protein
MSLQKRQALDSLLADILREPPLIPTHATTPPPETYFNEPESEVTAARGHEIDAAPQVHAADERISEVHASHEVHHTSAEVNISAAEEKAVKLAEQSKALLAGLNRDTAIRLRWAMRDIKAKRTKFTPVAPNDLEALLDLGFVTIVDERPILTDAGFLALD